MKYEPTQILAIVLLLFAAIFGTGYYFGSERSASDCRTIYERATR